MKMGNLTVRYLQPEEYSLWEDFVENNPQGTVFHHYYWHKFVFSYEPEVDISVVCCFSGEKIAAGTVIGKRRRMIFLNFMVSPFASPFFGVLVDERETKYISKKESFRFQVLRKLLHFIDKEYHFVTFNFPPDFVDIRLFTWEKFNGRVQYTYRQNIENPSLLYENFLPALKRQIKKGEKINYSIKDTVDNEHLGEVFLLIKKSSDRQRIPLKFHKSQIEQIIHSAEIKKHVKVFSIWMENIPVSGMIIVYDKSCSYYWLAGADPQYFSSGLNQLLMWEVIKKLSGEGMRCFDFVGANTESIATYKSAFNFRLVPYYQVSGSANSFLKWLLFLRGVG